MSAPSLTVGPAMEALDESHRGMSLDQLRLSLAHLSGWVAGAIDAHGSLSRESFLRACEAARRAVMGRAS